MAMENQLRLADGYHYGAVTFNVAPEENVPADTPSHNQPKPVLHPRTPPTWLDPDSPFNIGPPTWGTYKKGSLGGIYDSAKTSKPERRSFQSGTATSKLDATIPLSSDSPFHKMNRRYHVQSSVKDMHQYRLALANRSAQNQAAAPPHNDEQRDALSQAEEVETRRRRRLGKCVSGSAEALKAEDERPRDIKRLKHGVVDTEGSGRSENRRRLSEEEVDHTKPIENVNEGEVV